MIRRYIFNAVRDMLLARDARRPFTTSEVKALDEAIDAATAHGGEGTTGPIDLIDVSVLKAAAPERAAADLAPWVDPLKAVCRRYEIDSVRRIAAFVTALAHEGGFKVGARENMNYSAARLSAVWPSRFPANPRAGQLRRDHFANQPERLANEVYANRMGNGPASSGDGWRFRGNGPLQLTGRDNHEAFAKAAGMSVDEAVVWIGTLEGGLESAAWFWDVNDVNRLADTPGVADETKQINGGTVGLADRTARFDRTVKRLLEREAQ